jgi:vacuolar-type H+-ATPase subunit F/Vma7
MAEHAHILDDDAEALRVRRAELHDFMREIAAAALMLPAPETYLEAERAVRAITIADRMAQMLRDEAEEATEEKQETPPPPKTAVPLPTSGAEKEARDPIRTALRSLGDRMMAAAKAVPMPDSALSVWRALRYARACERMLAQLYAAPQLCTSPKPRPAPPVEEAKPPIPQHLRLETVRRELWEKYSQSPEAQAIRAAKQRAAQLAIEAEIAELTAPKPGTTVAGSAEDTTTPTDDAKASKPRPNISEEQADSHNNQTPLSPDPP